MGSMRYFFNALLLIAVGILLTMFLLRNNYAFPDSAISLINSISPKSGYEDFISVPIKEIMKSPVSLNQDDQNLIKIIRNEFLIPPSDLPYHLKDNTDNNPSKGQASKIRELLGNKKNGFFVECGALDGETRSNTLLFEKVFGWQGVLIEADPRNFELVLKKHRKAWAVPACLSTYPYPNMVMFQQNFNIGKISNVPIGQANKQANLAEVQCLPFYSILLAMNNLSVDYFSLDVEGHELEVLKTIPWEKVNITTLSVEFVHGREGKSGLRRYMERQGYKVYAEVTHPGGLANDLIFYHPLLLNKSAS